MAGKTASDKSVPSEPPPPYELIDSPNTPSSSTSARPQRGGKHNSVIPQSWRNILQTFFLDSTSRQVRQTVSSLIEDIIKVDNSVSDDEAKIALRNCAEACSKQGISLSPLLQKKCHAGHTAVYWAIINRSRGPSISNADSGEDSLLTTILDCAEPLKPATVEEAREACLIASNDALFQRLRLSQDPARPLLNTDRMLLGGNGSEQVNVLDVSQDGKAFVVDLKLMQFQKRMKVSKAVSVEFIAKSRMWRLEFRVSNQNWAGWHGIPAAGTWYVSLSLLRGSPATYIDSRLMIINASLDCPPPGDRSLLNVYSDASTPPEDAFRDLLRKSPQWQEPGIVCRYMRTTRDYELQPPGGFFEDAITVPLEASSAAPVLQYTGSEFIGSDNSLRARFEAKLDKPQKECIIC